MTNNIINFTHNNIIKIKVPKEKREIYKDSKELGLILIVSYGGSKIFYLAKKIDAKYYRIKIGSFPEASIAEAREKAAELKAQIAKGINPAEKIDISDEEEVKNELNFKTLFDKYINDYAQYRVKRWKDIIADMNRQASHLYEKAITDITREDVQDIFNDLTKAKKFRAANVAVERFKRIFNKLVEWGFIEKNPINKNNITLHKEKERERYLTEEEIAVFFNAVKEATLLIRDYIYISLYTAARKENVLSMAWKDINWKNQTWEIPNTKNGKPHVIPLLPPVIEI